MTATLFENEVDTSIDELVDLESDIPCDTDECEFPAEYQCRSACCGDTILPCEECLILTKEWLKAMKHKDIKCRICGWQGPCTPEWLIVIGRL